MNMHAKFIKPVEDVDKSLRGVVLISAIFVVIETSTECV